MILAAAAALNIPGPGGLSVSIDTVGPAPTYSVIVDSDTLVSPSPLGLVTDYADLATNLRAAGPVQIKDTVIDYTLDRIKKKTVNKRAVKATIPFVNPQGWRMGIEFVLTDNDMPFHAAASERPRVCARHARGHRFRFSTADYPFPHAPERRHDWLEAHQAQL